VNKGFWDGLTDDQRTAFRDAWESVIDDERTEAMRRQNAAAEENASNGVVIHEPDAAEVAEVNARLLELAPAIAAELDVAEDVVALAQAEIAKLD
jgi:TRAP-type C4-dicarboxylate transport system substrate-binding protein